MNKPPQSRPRPSLRIVQPSPFQYSLFRTNSASSRPALRLVHPAAPAAQEPMLPGDWPSGAPPMVNPPAWAQRLADNLNRGVMAGVETS
ncbi:MAG: hypothetical protein ACREU2_09975 [Steroidobacteraceae bacterium]